MLRTWTPGRRDRRGLAGHGDAPAESLVDRVYREIRDRIIAGSYPQGSRLGAGDRRPLGVSRIRSGALPRLELNGFITRRRGAAPPSRS